MPCVVTQEEEDYYNKLSNLKNYGLSELTSRITVRVACELSKIIEKHNLTSELSPTAIKWIEKHKEEDANESQKSAKAARNNERQD